jgi:hypothetical protein
MIKFKSQDLKSLCSVGLQARSACFLFCFYYVFATGMTQLCHPRGENIVKTPQLFTID